MSELEFHSIKRKSFQGIFVLIQRTFFLQIITAVSTGLQLAFLTKSEFGIFGIVNSVIAFLGYFADVGLAAALIQKKDALTEDDLRTTFTIQQMLVCIVVVIGLVFSSSIAQWYRLDSAGVWLFRALLCSFLLSSLKTIPAILLERNLDFGKLVVPQIIETVVFNGTVIFLAWKGFGVLSFTWAVLLRGFSGLFVMYWIAPWKISFGVSFPVAKRLFRYGIPFQGNSFLALLKDDVLFLFLARVFSVDQMGIIYTAKRLSELPLRSIMDNVTRVTFPAFSRIQNDAKILSSVVSKTLFGIALIVFPVYSAMIFFVRPFIELVPRYQKWEPAIVTFYLLCIASVIASLSTPLTSMLNAIGKVKITLGLMVMWIILTWILILLFIPKFGTEGFGMGLSILGLTIFVVVYVVKKNIQFSFLDSIKIPGLGTIVLSTWFYFSLQTVVHTWISILGIGITGMVLYTTIVWWKEKKRINEIINSFRGK